MKTLSNPRDLDELMRRLKQVRPDSTAKWGRMSAHQMVCHLSDAFRMATGAKLVNPVTSLLRRTVVKWLALYTPAPWPPGFATLPEVDQERGGTRPGDFANDIADLKTRLAAFPHDRLHAAHPLFGRMSSRDWFRWAYLHTDHHLRQFGI